MTAPNNRQRLARRMRRVFYAGFAAGFVVCLLAAAAMADTAPLPIRAGIVQCGVRDELPRACAHDARCCALAERFAAGRPACRTWGPADDQYVCLDPPAPRVVAAE